MGDRVFREFHDGAPSRPVPAPAARARKPPVTLSADAAATLLRGVLGHTLDGRTHAGILPVVSGTAQLFRHHRLEAHLARWSRDTGTEVPGFDPDRVLSNAAALALSMERTVETVHAALGASGIPALLLRGPAVSKRYYPAETLRFFRDIDLLVPKDRLQQAAEVLRSLGYKPDRDLDYWGKRGEWPFSDGTRIVELHWEAYPSPFDELDGLRGEELWQGHDTIEVGSANVACLSRDHLLLSSMLHAAYEHYFDRLVRFVDIRQMVKRDGDAVDWDRIGGMIRTTGTSLALVKELECMDPVLPIPVPDSWRKGLRASAFWKTAADLVLPNDAVISGKKRFHSLRRRLFRSVLKLSR
jgi:hypothetical protein